MTELASHAAVSLDASFEARPHDVAWGKALDAARDLYVAVSCADQIPACDGLKVIAEMFLRMKEEAIAERRFELLTEAKIIVEGAIAAVERSQKKANTDAREWAARLVK